MSDANLHAGAIEAITVINAAVRNLQLYPPSSAMIQTSLLKVHQTLAGLLARHPSVVYAETEKSLLVQDQPLSEKDLQKPPVRAWMQTMIDFGIRTITLYRGLEKDELKAFLTLLSRKPEEIASSGGFHPQLKHLNLRNIRIDEKLYVAMDKGQRLAASPSEDEPPAGTPDASSAVASAGETGGPDRLSRVLFSGIQPFADLAQGGSSPDTQVVFDHLLTDLAGLSDAGGASAIQEAAAAAGRLDVNALVLLLSQDFNTEPAEAFYQALLDRLDDDKFRQVAARLRSAENSAPGSGPDAPSGTSEAYHRMSRFARGQRMSETRAGIRLDLPQDRSARILHVKSAVEHIMKGARSPFEDDAVVRALPGVVQQLVAKDKAGTFDALMDKIGQAVTDPTPKIRANAAGALALTLQALPEINQAQSAQRLLPQIIGLTECQDRSSPAIDSLFAQLKAIIQTHIRNRRYLVANRILQALNRGAASPTAAETMRNLARSLVHTLADDALLKNLLEAHQSSPKDVKPAIVQTLRLLSPASVDFLLERLRTSEVRSLRSHLLQMLPEFGDDLRPALLGQLEHGGPWYYLRNLIGLLGKVGRAEDLAQLEPMLRDKDVRIQRETLGSLFSIGGERRGDVLLRFLPEADDSLKINVVTLLGALEYGPAVGALIDHLEARSARSGKTGEALAEQICIALGRLRDPTAIPALEKILQPRGLFGRAPNEAVQVAARQAVDQIRTAPRPPASGPPPLAVARQEEAASTTTDVEIDRSAAPTDPETEIDRLAAAGDTETAIARTLTLIKAEARAKRFAAAERLRDKLYDIDAMALGQIIEAGEIIEAEKSQALDTNHLEIFTALYTRLSESERNTLYHAMSETVCAPAEPLITQGQANDRLCFINRGEVKIVYRQENREFLVQQLTAGSLAGAESFFNATVATVSAISLGRVEAAVLTRAGLEALGGDHPGLVAKLQDYCLGLDATAELLRRKGMDRRAWKRISLKGKVSVQLQDDRGQASGRPFSGNLADFSIGGLSFGIRSGRPDTARILLGRRLGIAFTPAAPDPVAGLAVQGTVIGVNYLLENDYSIHVRFDRPLDPAIGEALDTRADPAR